jgi:DNA ligase (NAD+)
LVLVDEIGDELQSVVEFFDNQENIVIIEGSKFGIQFEIIEKINLNATEKLSGKIFVVSGVLKNFLVMI